MLCDGRQVWLKLLLIIGRITDPRTDDQARVGVGPGLCIITLLVVLSQMLVPLRGVLRITCVLRTSFGPCRFPRKNCSLNLKAPVIAPQAP